MNGQVTSAGRVEILDGSSVPSIAGDRRRQAAVAYLFARLRAEPA